MIVRPRLPDNVIEFGIAFLPVAGKRYVSDRSPEHDLMGQRCGFLQNEVFDRPFCQSGGLAKGPVIDRFHGKRHRNEVRFAWVVLI